MKETIWYNRFVKKNIIAAVFIISVLLAIYFLQPNQHSSYTNSTPTPTITAVEKSLQEQMIDALSQKNNWDASRVELHVLSVEGDYAKGDVKFKDELGGGLWFAAKVNNTWKIVYDGNGIIMCDQLKDYPNFPKDMIPSCFDKESDQLITR